LINEKLASPDVGVWMIVARRTRVFILETWINKRDFRQLTCCRVDIELLQREADI